MPNPLIAAFQAKTSKAPPERPKPLEPILEDYVGDNNAWRGTETHGVESADHAEAYDVNHVDIDNQDGVRYEKPIPEENPIPVTIVDEFGRERRMHRESQYPVDSQVRQVVGRHERRRSVRIRNIPQVTSNVNSAPTSEAITTQTNQTISGTSSEVTIPATNWTSITFFLNVTSLTGTAPDLTFTIEETIDGTNWATAATFTPNVTAAGYYSTKVTGPISTRVRVRWVLNSGTMTDLDFNVRSMRFPVTPSQSTVGQEVYIGHDLSLTTYTGYKLEPGQEVSFTTENEIFAVCIPGETSMLNIIDEFSVEL